MAVAVAMATGKGPEVPVGRAEGGEYELAAVV